MIALYLLGIALGGTTWQAPVDTAVSTITILDGDREDVRLTPLGEVRARRERGRTSLEVRFDAIDSLTVFGETFRANVVWAVSPEGDYENLGELHINGRRAELNTTTALQRFGILVTVEPYHFVDRPSGRVAARSSVSDGGDLRAETVRLTLGGDALAPPLDLPPSGNLPPRVVQARAAFRIAEFETDSRFAQAEFRQARVALESMEQLLRRPIDSELLDEFVNNSIRLSARAIRASREEKGADQLRSMTRRAESAESRIDELQFQLRLAEEEIEELSEQASTLRSEREEAVGRIRDLSFARDQLERELEQTRRVLDAAEDPWPPLLDALVGAGAGQVPRGARVVMGTDFFEDGASLAEGAREPLARLVGILRFGTVPHIRVEGHTPLSDSTTNDLDLSQSRADAVRDYLVNAGVPADNIVAQGFGASRPALGAQDPSDSINERVEIMILEP